MFQHQEVVQHEKVTQLQEVVQLPFPEEVQQLVSEVPEVPEVVELPVPKVVQFQRSCSTSRIQSILKCKAIDY